MCVKPIKFILFIYIKPIRSGLRSKSLLVENRRNDDGYSHILQIVGSSRSNLACFPLSFSRNPAARLVDRGWKETMAAAAVGGRESYGKVWILTGRGPPSVVSSRKEGGTERDAYAEKKEILWEDQTKQLHCLCVLFDKLHITHLWNLATVFGFLRKHWMYLEPWGNTTPVPLA